MTPSKNTRKIGATWSLILVAVLSLNVFFSKTLHAVFVAPRMVMLEENQRTARVTVNNRSAQTKIITFDWEHRAMTEDGKMKKLKDGETLPGYKPADPYIKYSPRRIILRPGQHQKVKLLVQRPPDMENGEYRSHLLIQENNYQDPELDTEGAEKGLTGQLIINVSKSIPIFVRQGETTVNITSLQAERIFKEGKPFIRVSFNNDSTRSIYGQFQIDCQLSDGTFIKDNIGILRIYAEGKNFVKDMPLEKKIDTSACTSLITRIVGKYDTIYKGKTLARVDTAL